MAGGNLFRKFVLMMPHGIFEFSSLIIGTAARFLLLKFIYKFIKSKPFGRFFEAFDEYFKIIYQFLILFGVAFVLMVIAGFIEVYVIIH